ncbi:MAG: DUF6677 family protein [Phycisphaerae bacterium]
MNPGQASSSPLFRPASLVAAIVLPGLGHFIGGERLRGLLIAVGVLGLFFGGMLIGGIDVIDSREDRVWFFGQALVGPTAFAVDWAHQTQFKVIDPNTKQLRTAFPGEGRDASGMAVPGGTPPNIKSINKVNDIGTLYATIAGMLNLICILDAGWPPRRRHNPAVA